MELALLGTLDCKGVASTERWSGPTCLHFWRRLHCCKGGCPALEVGSFRFVLSWVRFSSSPREKKGAKGRVVLLDLGCFYPFVPYAVFLVVTFYVSYKKMLLGY